MRVWEILRTFSLLEGADTGNLSLPNAAERRAEARYEVEEGGTVTTTHPRNNKAVAARVKGVSPHAMRLWVGQEIHAGSQIRVAVQNAVVFGTVQHSRLLAGGGYEIGIELNRVRIDPAPPILRESSARYAAQSEATDAPVSTQRNKSAEPLEILLVEGNPDDRDLTKIALSDARIPHTLTVAEDGRQALNRLFDHTKPAPGLVLIDLDLPKVNGFEVLRMMREETKLRGVAVAVLSRSLAISDMRAAHALGVQAYFTKPDDLDQYTTLGASIRTFIAQLC